MADVAEGFHEHLARAIHRSDSNKAPSCAVTPNPGPLVRGSPSVVASTWGGW